MKSTTFKILFYIQKTRVAKNGEVPILVRVTVDGRRCVLSVNLKIDPNNWNAIVNKSIGNSRMDKELNARLDTIRLRLMQVYRERELDGEKISAEGIVDKYLGRDTKPKIMLMQYNRVDSVLKIAKTITTIRLRLPLNEKIITRTMMLTPEHQSILPLFGYLGI